MGAYSGDITRLLMQLRQGDREAKSQLAELVYADLRRIARAKLRGERANHTIQPSALVNEAWIRLVGQQEKDWQNRAHFYAVAAQMMRRFLVDYARRVNAKKNGGGAAAIPLDDISAAAPDLDLDLVLDLDAALTDLNQLDERQARLVELRFFAGLTEDQAAEVMGVTGRTVTRDWSMARKFLRGRLGGDSAATPS